MMFEPLILNFPTKEGWRTRSSLPAIQKGLEYLRKHVDEWEITSLAVPPLGCGQGGLEWSVVGRVLYQGLAQLGIPVELYAPYGTPHRELQIKFLDAETEEIEVPDSKMPAAGVALATILDRIVSQKHHYPIGRTGMREIAYFATRAGIPTGLEFEWRPKGSYAEGLSRLLTNLTNHGLIREHKKGQMYVTQPGPTLADAQLVFQDDLRSWEVAIERVADLFLRLPTAKWAKLVATVKYQTELLENHHHAGGKDPVSEQKIIESVARKQNGKNMPTNIDILDATRTLSFLRWIDVQPSKDEADSVFI